jgi:DNA repair protein RadC
MQYTIEVNLDQVEEIELIYRSNVKVSNRPKILSSKDAYNVLIRNWNFQHLEFIEEFKIALLNQANRVLGIYPLSKGGLTSTITDTRLIFAAALKSGATGIVLAHNHPSGQLKPSEADLLHTRTIQSAGLLFDIKVLDHLIITSEGYFSFSDNELI